MQITSHTVRLVNIVHFRFSEIDNTVSDLALVHFYVGSDVAVTEVE